LDRRSGILLVTDSSKENFEDKEFQDEVKSTKSLIQTLLQTLKAFRLYEYNHPILSKFIDRLRKEFDNYFEEFDSFSLQIGEYNLYFKGKVVYESKDIKESLAFHFFKDGIREIRFLKGLEFEELIDFLNIVRKSDFINRLEDDLVTLLWERDFSHIFFTTIDEFLEGKSSSVPATIEDFQSKLEYRVAFEQTPIDMGYEVESQGNNYIVVEDLKQVINSISGGSIIQACQLDSEEMKSIYQEVRREEEPDDFYIIDNLIEILLHLGEDVDAYENMISYFDKLIESLIEHKKLEVALSILKSLSNTMESIVLKDKQIFAIQRILENTSKPHLIEYLGKILNENDGVNFDSINQYLSFMGKKAIDPLCLLLKDLRSGKWRKLICERIAALCQEDITPISKFLSDDNPFFLSHMIYIVGKIGNPSSIKYLGNLINHNDPKVREEVLYVLYKFGDKGGELIQKFLTDPVSELRMKASLLFAKTTKERAFEPLKEILLSKDFYKRDYNEKSSFFRALAETGSKDLVPVLRKIANKKKWFGRAKWNEMRLCAKNTLKMIGST